MSKPVVPEKVSFIQYHLLNNGKIDMNKNKKIRYFLFFKNKEKIVRGNAKINTANIGQAQGPLSKIKSISLLLLVGSI